MTALSVCVGLFAAAPSATRGEEITESFSEFLVEQANANLNVVLGRRLKDDENVRCYFPQTYALISSTSLDNLFLWKR